MIRECAEITSPLSECAVAIGTFDGVHIGHVKVIGSAAEKAAALGVPTRVLTFPDLPGDSIKTRARAPRIMSNALRERELINCGADDICYFDLKNGGSEYTAERFVDEVICGKLNAKEVFCGFNFRFGKGGSGDAERLKELLSCKGVELTVIEPVLIGEKPVSSSRIRSMIAEGDVENAALALGRAYSTDFEVEHGNRIGRSIGFPTVNNRFPIGRLLPGLGVYVTRTFVNGEWYGSVTNVGTRPTVGGQEVTEETHILDFDGELYSKSVEVEYIKRLRSEKYFDSLEELRSQIKKDVLLAKEVLKEKFRNINSVKERE